MTLSFLWQTWKLSRYGKIGHVRYFDWFPLFEISWSIQKRWIALNTQGNVSEDCEPVYDRRRMFPKRVI